ncbi:cobalt transport protein [Staphylothermus marinus F1]|uniref:Cobalt transport protein n=1 Tax=Staphylothermus marinus (strain ATCC 43588 / DSM 3639 / JCM 9404 / F1) TaxID=399550 RepID=A3DKF8_STAMF|nr:energy-coupling factor transporter transmembrane component T [Staphylothermus marinus]ABN69118.1 cobalt transport protein [Staphylothermus marinus F1]
MKNYIRSFFEEVALIMDMLNIHNPNPKLDPLILFVVSVILSFQASFTTNIVGLIIPLTYSLILIFVLKLDHRIIARIELFVLFIGLVVSFPLLFTRSGNINGLYDLNGSITFMGIYSFAKLLMRVTLSPLPLLVAIAYLGWTNVLKAMSRFKAVRNVVSYIALTTVLIPRIIRYSIQLIIARDARNVKNSYSNIWRSLSAIVGDTLIHSHNYADKLQYAYTARTIGCFKTYSGKIRLNIATLFFMFLSILAITWETVAMLYGSY